MKKSSDTIGNRNRDLPVCSAVPQPLRHHVPRSATKENDNWVHLEMLASLLALTVAFERKRLLGALAKLEEAAISFLISVCQY
jgi:hypothetical protein